MKEENQTLGHNVKVWAYLASRARDVVLKPRRRDVEVHVMKGGHGIVDLVAQVVELGAAERESVNVEHVSRKILVEAV